MPISNLSRFSKIFHTIGDVLGDKWSRKRGTLGPVPLFATLLQMSVMGTNSYRQALSAVHAELGDVFNWGEQCPSASAYAQQRRRFKADDCYNAVQSIMQVSHQAERYPVYACSSFTRLLSVDGTFTPLSPSKELNKHFGFRINQSGPAKVPTAGIVAMWNIGSNQPVGWDLQGASMDERGGATRLFHYLTKGDLLIADRGYPGLSFFHDIVGHGADYLIRMNTTTVAKTNEFKAFLDSEQSDLVVAYGPESAARKKRRWEGDDILYVRYVKSHSKKHGTRVWATSVLDKKRLSVSKIKALYDRRWNIETAFFECKQWHGLRSLRAKFVDGIHQEVSVIFLFMWMVSELEAEARVRYFKELKKNPDKEPPVRRVKDITDVPIRFNRLEVGTRLGHMLKAALCNPEKLKQSWRRALLSIWRYRSKPRPKRSFPRESKHPHGLSNLRGRVRGK